MSLTYSPPQDRDIYTVEERTLLYRALGKLNWQERLLYHLCFVIEQDAHEVAVVLGIEVQNVYKRKHLLVLKLTRLVQILENH